MKNYFLCIRDSVRRLDPEHVPHAIRPLREVGHLVQHVHNLLHAAALAVALRDLSLPAPTRDAEMRPEKTMRSDRVLPHRSAIAAVSASPKASSDTPLESRNSPVNPSNNAQNSRWSASCSTAEQLWLETCAQSTPEARALLLCLQVKPSSMGVSKARQARSSNAART